MDTILHVVDLAASPQQTFDAVSTAQGLARWWSTRVEADERLGGIVRFKFIPDFNPEMEITEMEPASTLAWKCVGGAPPWLNAAIRFDIAPRGERSLLTFTQRYAGDLPDEAYGTFNYNWGYYLHSLQQYLETGLGTPHPAP
jgi:uncharacterized protein YndB with AHSA1/START domain